MNKTNLNSPAEVLMSFIMEDAAEKIGIDVDDLLEFLSGETIVDSDIDKELHNAFDTPINFWVELQDKYDDYLEGKETIIC